MAFKLSHRSGSSTTFDILKNYDTSPSTSPERDSFMEGPRPLLLGRNDSRFSNYSTNSSVNLLQDTPIRGRTTRSDSTSRWKLPLHSFGSQNRKNAKQRKRGKSKPHWHGWKAIVFGSWLNVLLILLPISWSLDATMEHYKTLIFIFCILSMIPLVKLHELATKDLSLRIGGSKTGLLNATMSNTVEIVIAITALRRCEIRVVQSSLIGSILSKLLLVLGMCFFAGGLRFSEQDFDATAQLVSSSLLSISVGAVLLPAAYHFALAGGGTLDPNQQKRDILKMSRGVSIVLLFIYVAYLVFQLWSHAHLYQERTEGSKRHSPAVKIKLPVDTRLKRKPSRTKDTGQNNQSEKWTGSSGSGANTPSPIKTPPPTLSQYMDSPWASSSQITLTGMPAPNVNPTVRIVHGGADSGDVSRASSPVESLKAVPLQDVAVEKPREEPQKMDDLQAFKAIQESEHKEPELSWTMTVLLITSITVLVSLNADWLVESMDGISGSISKEWVGLILLPAVGSIAELVTAMNTSVEDQLTLSVSVAIGSTIQTALFVIPLMVTLGWALGKPLALLFDPFESVVLYISVHTMGYIVADGKSNWLEGLLLVSLYVIIAVSFWFYPGSNLASSLAVCT
ncbi:hypothetical protein PLICRDRAFT_40167 [Plicaturopsis crispa FD-325 SS-3]|nr:hypothetical protein PLICRDRAFT_40167 [Plicaturopsis crispa FD-325 SS-3]